MFRPGAITALADHLNEVSPPRAFLSSSPRVPLPEDRQALTLQANTLAILFRAARMADQLVADRKITRDRLPKCCQRIPGMRCELPTQTGKSKCLVHDNLGSFRPLLEKFKLVGMDVHLQSYAAIDMRLRQHFPIRIPLI